MGVSSVGGQGKQIMLGFCCSPNFANYVLHAAKTSLAALLSVLVCKLLGLDEPLWAVVSSIIVMQADIGGSLKVGWMRLTGTFVGACFAVLFGTLISDLLIAMPTAVFCTVLVCMFIPKLRESVRLSGLTAAVVLMLHEPGLSIYYIGSMRFVETALGISVALAISLLVFPCRATVSLRQGLAKAMEECHKYYDLVFTGLITGKVDLEAMDKASQSLHKLRDNNARLLDLAVKEPRSRLRTTMLATISRHQQRLEEHIRSMEHACELINYAEGFHLSIKQELQVLAEQTLEGIELVAMCLRDRVTPPPLTLLAEAMADLNEKLLTIRREKKSADYDLSEVMRAHAFVTEMRYAATVVLETADRLNTYARVPI